MTQTTNTKPKPRKVRGTGTYVGDEFTFTPYEQGEPAQRNVKTTKGGKVYETCSEKKPMKVAYLTCAADAADPWSEYTSQLKKLGARCKGKRSGVLARRGEERDDLYGYY